MNWKSAITALIAAAFGSTANASDHIIMIITQSDWVNTALERGAWTVAILAGCVSIVNGVKKWSIFKNKRHEN